MANLQKCKYSRVCSVVLYERRSVFLSDINGVTWCLYFFR